MVLQFGRQIHYDSGLGEFGHMLSAEQVPMMRYRCQEPANKDYELTTRIANGVCVCVCVRLCFSVFEQGGGMLANVFFGVCG